ncbi:hypothetical protein JRO89_XSUnG0002900 [Xanthoceras sorbifolium]|uniref:Uncharacterized protein n=1 Tax=Xanthoceras sorbifolium TaxID=99658 RepID=A0ABQ8H0E1_9ROSI|nr:hypothetical protein JRO89_XSUnG0002900 [Xanthoceras sorbifolium]
MTTAGNEEPQDSQTNHENLGYGKLQLLDNQLKEIQVQLRENNEEIKRLRETVKRSWKRLSTVVHAVSSIQQPGLSPETPPKKNNKRKKPADSSSPRKNEKIADPERPCPDY